MVVLRGVRPGGLMEVEMAEESRARTVPPRRGMPVIGGLGVGAVLLELTKSVRYVDPMWDDDEPASGDIADDNVDVHEHHV